MDNGYQVFKEVPPPPSAVCVREKEKDIGLSNLAQETCKNRRVSTPTTALLHKHWMRSCHLHRLVMQKPEVQQRAEVSQLNPYIREGAHGGLK